MAKRRGQTAGEKKWPGSILREIVKVTPPEELIEDLAVTHRARAAFWRLLELGPSVEPLVRQALRHPHPGVRAHACAFFDRNLTPGAYPGLLELLDDPDAEVRRQARHALSCDKCKREAWHPPAEAASLVCSSLEKESPSSPARTSRRRNGGERVA